MPNKISNLEDDKPSSKVILQLTCPALRHINSGKIREVFEIDNDRLLFVTTDRLSAFDIVFKNSFPDKGKILNKLSIFWFKFLKPIIPSHYISDHLEDYPDVLLPYKEILDGRSVMVKKLQIFPVEFIVRNYLTGSGWKDYVKTGSLCGMQLPTGLTKGAKLPSPVLTPSDKAPKGEHDVNITPDQAKELIGKKNYNFIEEKSILIFKSASEHAAKKGLILVDMKMEFGVDNNGTICIADEILTPDCARFWLADTEEAKCSSEPISMDKQFLRDYLEKTGYDKKTAIMVSNDMLNKTSEKYHQVYYKLTGSTDI